MAQIFKGDVVLIRLDCKEDVDGQSDLFIRYQKPISGAVGQWQATGSGNYAEYTTTKDADIDEAGTWHIQPWSDTHDVHGDMVKMKVFEPLIPFSKASISVFMEGETTT